MKKIAKIIAVLLAVVIILMIWIKLGSPQPKTPSPPPPPLAVLEPGQTRTSEEIKHGGFVVQEVTKVDSSRLKATYEPGKTYASLMKAVVTSKGSYKDWGVTTNLNFHYLAEFQFSRFIVSNDGDRMTYDIQVDRSVTVSVFTKVESVKVELGGWFQTALEIGGGLYNLPPGSSEVARQSLESLLNSEISKEFIEQVAADELAKCFTSVESLQGKKARIVVGNGSGVISITPVDCALDGDEQLLLGSMSTYSDVLMMKSLDCKPGDSWLVNGHELMSIFDPSLKSQVGGSVTIRRGKDIGDEQSPKAQLSMAGGVLTLKERHYQSESGKIKQLGSWAPKGDLIFDFESKIVTEASLTGAIEISEESTDHILFQMKNVMRPVYEVQYSAWMAEGNRLDHHLKEVPPVKQSVLEKLRKGLNAR